MKRLGLALLLMALAAACAPAPESAPPMPAPTKSAPPEAARPASPPPLFSAVCDEAGAAGQQTALAAALQAYLAGKTGPEALEGVKHLPDCMRALAMGGDGALLIHGRRGAEGVPAALAWKTADHWQVANTALQELPVAGSVTLTEGEPDLLLAVRLLGSAELGRLLHGRVDGGILTLSPITKAYEKAQYQFLPEGLILLTYRDGSPEPVAWTCEACTPANRQQLLAWTGSALEVRGEREFSDPYAAASHFLGALQAGHDQQAARYAADPSLVSRARELLSPSPEELIFPWEPLTDPGETAEFRRLEMRNWEALPEPVRTVLPESGLRYALPLRKGEDRVTLELSRDEWGWRVTGLQPEPGGSAGPGGASISVDETPRLK